MTGINLKSQTQFIKFALVGASNSAVYLGVYYMLVCSSSTLLAALIGQSTAWILSVANSFVWNRKFVFDASAEVWWRAMGKTFAGYSSCFVLSSVLTVIQLELLGIPAAIVPIVNLPIMGPINFLILKYWAFRNRDAAAAETPCYEAELHAESA